LLVLRIDQDLEMLSLEDYLSVNATQILIQREIVELLFTCTRSFLRILLGRVIPLKKSIAP